MHYSINYRFDWFGVEHFKWTPGCYLVLYDDAYQALVYCDGSYLYDDETCSQPFPYAHEVQAFCVWDGFPTPKDVVGARRLYDPVV